MIKSQSNLTDQAYDRISQKIIKTIYKPGSKISEKAIESDLKIGRTPIREALLRLKQEQLIEVIPQSGTYISKIDLKSVLDARFVRTSIEQQVMKEAAIKKISDSQKLLLEINLQNQYKSMIIKDFNLFLDLDNEFHHTFYELTNHSKIWNWIQTINVQFDRYRFLSLNVEQLSWERLINDHQDILKAVLDHETSRVQDCTKHHLNLALEEEKTVIDKFPEYFINKDI
ncbi:MAG: GntR family transcriptional regulator [Lactobacillus helsingborgensis]|uniref:GntR family transcriptional regulator n=1 Tax=Lactobacillus TaxID=1578 RepID=UPI000D6EFD85|nr:MULTISPECIES: GntR family transcriptional regulator [Lactobacillus]AWN33140.1 GntR family transcriptional regulator [Lactobacillus helsingborgensis]MCT6811550.1 GntR family transcriptional regulator [Lactobacillus helsingborgensis]MCT6827480.1 GntR family transcriptional regulator [Lactobacillus helsingborgensis]MCT6846473.1 GntR family transcriptional regulator [Lactobacillus helsingborgensis]RMC53605.1 GntR family transcriptional regulator [Lactobacillus sp. ESL0262]